MPNYTIVYTSTASTTVDITADTVEAAVDQGYDEMYVSLCHQCAHKVDISDEWDASAAWTDTDDTDLLDGPTEVEVLRRAICKFLVGSALADHLGDVRNSEVDLYDALGITASDREAYYWDHDDGGNSSFKMLQHFARERHLPVPDYVLADEED